MFAEKKSQYLVSDIAKEIRIVALKKVDLFASLRKL